MRDYDLISFDQLIEGPGAGYTATAASQLGVKTGGPADKGQQPGKKTSAGCVVLPSLTAEGLGRCWVRHPQYKGEIHGGWGYWAFPKGTVDTGESYERAAKREVHEETGIVCSVLPGGHLGMFEDDHAKNHFYIAVQVRKTLSPHDKETSVVKLVTFDEAHALFSATSSNSESKRDLKVLAKTRAWVEAFKQAKGIQ
jgi:8-oxo-dGTP pyrophosphatase MutT (NUDIX family)